MLPGAHGAGISTLMSTPSISMSRRRPWALSCWMLSRGLPDARFCTRPSSAPLPPLPPVTSASSFIPATRLYGRGSTRSTW
ncbi:hypothetical protein BJF78_30300 [Pseudonocardia sp. CNS-139]|nr:hypothetical protein BJF78_30300 [Pseudonocardia sp. CNS-139]